MTRPTPSTLVRDSGGAPSPTIQDTQGTTGMGLDMDLGIDQDTPTPILAMPPVDRILVPADQALVLRLQRTHRHECSSEDEMKDPSAGSDRFW